MSKVPKEIKEFEKLASIVLANNMSNTFPQDLVEKGQIDKLLMERYDGDLYTFTKIVQDLLPFTPIVKSPVTGDLHHAFIYQGVTIVKQEETPCLQFRY